MNESWKNVRTQIRAINGVPFQTVVATDRLGFRTVIGESPRPSAALSGIDQTANLKKGLVLVDDSDEDALLFDFAVRKSGKDVVVSRARDGKQARQLLAGTRPSLIALDCHMPGESGLQLLKAIRSMESFNRVPIVMMSGTESDADVQTAYLNGANSFLRKPTSCDEYVDSVRVLLEYWLEKNCTHLTSQATPHGIWLG